MARPSCFYAWGFLLFAEGINEIIAALSHTLCKYNLSLNFSSTSKLIEPWAYDSYFDFLVANLLLYKALIRTAATRWLASVNCGICICYVWTAADFMWCLIACHSITCHQESRSPVVHNSYFVKLKNSMVWVRERTIPTERPPLVGNVIANFCG
jgi:hypothetical protein